MHPDNIPSWVKKIQKGYKGDRVKKDKIIIKLAKPLYKLGIHPNAVTAAGFLCAIIAVNFLFKNHLLFVIFYFLNFLCDTLDGTLARMWNKENKYGAYIDATSDAMFGILILIKSLLFFKNYLIFIPLFLYLWDIKKLNNWAPGFYPNVTWLKISYVFKLFTFGLILQTIILVFNITVRFLYGLKYDIKG